MIIHLQADIDPWRVHGFTGPVPECAASSWRQLETLSLHSCNVSGPLPPGLASLPRLTLLHLHGNAGLQPPLPADLASPPERLKSL